jgi:hypothetical protein
MKISNDAKKSAKVLADSVFDIDAETSPISDIRQDISSYVMEFGLAYEEAMSNLLAFIEMKQEMTGELDLEFAFQEIKEKTAIVMYAISIYVKKVYDDN